MNCFYLIKKTHGKNRDCDICRSLYNEVYKILKDIVKDHVFDNLIDLVEYIHGYIFVYDKCIFVYDYLEPTIKDLVIYLNNYYRNCVEYTKYKLEIVDNSHIEFMEELSYILLKLYRIYSYKLGIENITRRHFSLGEDAKNILLELDRKILDMCNNKPRKMKDDTNYGDIFNTEKVKSKANRRSPEKIDMKKDKNKEVKRYTKSIKRKRNKSVKRSKIRAKLVLCTEPKAIRNKVIEIYKELKDRNLK